MSELVSVIITTYGRSKTLHRAIKSVLGQTYPNLEILVVDDNADTENSSAVSEIVQEFTDTSIRLIQNEVNLGGALARNLGIQAASADFIAFLDDDDEYLPQKIEKQMEVMRNNKKAALIYNWAHMLDSTGKIVGEHVYQFRGNCLFESMCDCIAATSQWLCRKEALLDVGCFTDTPCKQDSYVILKLMLKDYEVDYVPEYLSLYNMGTGKRISRSGHKQRIEGETKLLALCRANYDCITKEQQKTVEFYFGARLLEHYLGERDLLNTLSCARLVMSKPFNKYSIKCYKRIAKQWLGKF